MQEIDELLRNMNALDAWLTAEVSRLLSAVDTWLTQLSDSLTGWLDGLPADLTPSGRLKALIGWLAGLGDLGAGGIAGLVDELLSGSVERLTGYFSLLTGVSFVAGNNLSRLDRQLRIQASGLIDATVGLHLREALTKGLTNAVLARADITGLRLIGGEILGRDGVAFRGLSSTLEEVSLVFVRAWTETAASGLKLTHYYYMGTQIGTTRAFCRDRIGRTYPKAEVEKWADLNWAGRMSGTTRETIFWYLGGYRCRHRLLPVTRRVYDFLNEKQKSNG